MDCFKCGEKGKRFYGYTICDSCKTKLRLFTEKTIEKYDSPTFKKEVSFKLEQLEKDYISKKIKLLNILEQLR